MSQVPALSSWISGVLKDFNIAPEQIIGATTDSGPDIKAAILKSSIFWEWCPCHLLARAMEEAFGMSRLCKNIEAAEIIKSAVKTIYLVKQSSSAGSLFSEISGNLILKSFQRHRFLGIYIMFERILKLWPSLEAYFDIRSEESSATQDVEFPLDGKKDVQ